MVRRDSTTYSREREVSGGRLSGLVVSTDSGRFRRAAAGDDLRKERWRSRGPVESLGVLEECREKIFRMVRRE